MDMIKRGFTLGFFALICTALVALVNLLTIEKISAQQQAELARRLNQVIDENIYDNELIANCIVINNNDLLTRDIPLHAYRAIKNSKPVAIAMEAIAPDGYNGNIKLIIATNMQGQILGVRTIHHNETPGLGDKIELKRSDWVLNFNGLALTEQTESQWKVKKDGGQFDQFTGATITPRAYIAAIKRTITYIDNNREWLFAQEADCHIPAQPE